eukprot:scaffold316152_cov30-Tisochrysis_lutea.AAC.3
MLKPVRAVLLLTCWQRRAVRALAPEQCYQCERLVDRACAKRPGAYAMLRGGPARTSKPSLMVASRAMLIPVRWALSKICGQHQRPSCITATIRLEQSRRSKLPDPGRTDLANFVRAMRRARAVQVERAGERRTRAERSRTLTDDTTSSRLGKSTLVRALPEID